MSVPEHLSITLTSLLSSLGRAVPACDPQDVHATAGLKQKFGELQATLEREAQPHMAEICGAAARLVEELSVNGLVGPKETMEVVARIVASMRGSLGVAGEDGAHGGAGLRLIDGQRLGELLVTLSMLSPGHVERALELQKTNGMLLGEALVEQGVLTKESVQAALRLQEARRRREGQNGDFDSWRASRAS